MSRHEVDRTGERAAAETRILVPDLVGNGFDRMIAGLEPSLRFPETMQTRLPVDRVACSWPIWRLPCRNGFGGQRLPILPLRYRCHHEPAVILLRTVAGRPQPVREPARA
jgi:hypothetical protein